MKDPLSIPCSCGSGKKLKDCCLFNRGKPNTQSVFEQPELPDYTGVTVYFGFTKKHQRTSPFEIDFDVACCQVIQANKYLADLNNTMIQFPMLKPGDWYVMGKQAGKMKYSFRYDSETEAMDIAKEKFKAVRFLQPPEII